MHPAILPGTGSCSKAPCYAQVLLPTELRAYFGQKQCACFLHGCMGSCMGGMHKSFTAAGKSCKFLRLEGLQKPSYRHVQHTQQCKFAQRTCLLLC